LEQNIKAAKERINKVEDQIVEIRILRDSIASLEKVGGDNNTELSIKLMQQKGDFAG